MTFRHHIRFFVLFALAVSGAGETFADDPLSEDCADNGLARLAPSQASALPENGRASTAGDPSASLATNPAKSATPPKSEATPDGFMRQRALASQKIPSYSGVAKIEKPPAGLLPTPLMPVAPKLPAAHNEARLRAAEANRAILRQRSSDLKAKLAETGDYSDARLYDVVITGGGPHGSAVEYGLGAASSNRAKVAILNRGEVASPEVFGPVNPRDSHMTANPATVKGFPDNVAPGRSTMTLTDSVRAPDGAYPESSAVALHVEQNLARSPADLMFGVDNERVISREAVELARRVIAEGKVNPVDPDQIALAKEPIEKWPRQANFLIVTRDNKTKKIERLFAVNAVNATGLNRPRNPFPAGSAEFKLAEDAIQRSNPVNGPPPADDAKPKKGSDLVHEAAALLRDSEGRIDTLHGSGPVVALGSGPSAIVAMGRFIQRNPNPETPMHVLTRGPLDPVKDSPTLEALRTLNSDLYIVGVKTVVQGKPVDGQIEVTITDRNGDIIRFMAPEGRLLVTPERANDGTEMGTQIVSVKSLKDRVQHTVMAPDSLKLDATEGNPPKLAISFTPTGSTEPVVVDGQLIVAAGQDNSGFHDRQFGPNITAQEEKVFADVNFGYDPTQGPVMVGVARQTQGLRVQVGLVNGQPHFEEIKLAGGFYAVGPGARRGNDVLVNPRVSKSPNPSPDSLANTVSATEVAGARLFNPATLVSHKPLPPPATKVSLGPIRRQTTAAKPAFTLTGLEPPAHLKDLTAADAPSRKMLSEGLLSEAGRIFQRFAVAPNSDEATNRIEITFERDAKSGEISVKFDGAEGNPQAKAELEAAIRKDPRFADQLDAYMRANQSKLQMWLGFDTAGNFRPDLVRVSSPMDAMASNYLENGSYDRAVSYLPRVVEVGINGVTSPMVEANYRQLYEAPANIKVKVAPPEKDRTSRKTFHKVYREDKTTGAMKLDVVLVEYAHEDREMGVRAIAAAKYLADRGLGDTLANRPERAAEATVGRKDATTPKKVLMVVQKIFSSEGPLNENLSALANPQVPAQIAKVLARYHRTPEGTEKPFSHTAVSFIAEQFHTVPTEQRTAIKAFLEAPRWKNKVAHGDPRLMHLIPDGNQVRLAGVGQAIETKHPLDDMQILITDLSATPEGRLAVEPLVASYIRESQFNAGEAKLMRTLVASWVIPEKSRPGIPAPRVGVPQNQLQR